MFQMPLADVIELAAVIYQAKKSDKWGDRKRQGGYPWPSSNQALRQALEDEVNADISFAVVQAQAVVDHQAQKTADEIGNWPQLAADLIIHEGISLVPYTDTVGKLTIGAGRNLDDAGISHDEARALLSNDIGKIVKKMAESAPGLLYLSEPRQRGLANMVFNLGWGGFKGFKKMLAAVDAGDFELAASEALDSKWAAQVGPIRSRYIAKLIREG